MRCVCCLSDRAGDLDRCGATTNIDQPFCDGCEANGHNDPERLGTQFHTIPMERLIEERRKAIENR